MLLSAGRNKRGCRERKLSHCRGVATDSFTDRAWLESKIHYGPGLGSRILSRCRGHHVYLLLCVQTPKNLGDFGRGSQTRVWDAARTRHGRVPYRSVTHSHRVTARTLLQGFTMGCLTRHHTSPRVATRPVIHDATSPPSIPMQDCTRLS